MSEKEEFEKKKGMKIFIAENYLKVLKIFEKGSISNKMYDFLTEYSLTLQLDMEEFGLGLVDYLRPFGQRSIPNYQVFTNFPAILQIPREARQMIPTMKSLLIIYLRRIKETEFKPVKKTIQKKSKKPKIEQSSILALQDTLINTIYDQILKNPDLYSQKSRSITPQRKIAIKKRDNYQCQICCEEFDEDDLVIDHIYPYALGGSNKDINLMALCEECNDDKGKKLEYYQSEEGRVKILLNIRDFTSNLPWIKNFGKWLGGVRVTKKKKTSIRKHETKVSRKKSTKKNS